MSKRFLTYNTEDAGKVPVNSQGIIDPEKIPCYDSRDIRTVTYTFDGNLEGKEVVEFEGMPLVRLGVIEGESPLAMSFDLLLNVETGTTLSSRTDRFMYIDGLYYASSVFIIFNDIDGGLSKGVYSVWDEYSYLTRISVEYVASGELKTIDSKFLRDTAMIVQITENDDGTFASSHSGPEIVTAFEQGRCIMLRHGVITAPVTTIDPDTNYIEFQWSILDEAGGETHWYSIQEYECLHEIFRYKFAVERA